MSLFVANNIELKMGQKTILDKISFEIKPNQIIAIVGQNGSGKTSFLKIIAGLLDIDSGNTQLTNGVKIGYLPQDFELENLTSQQILQKYAYQNLGIKIENNAENKTDKTVENKAKNIDQKDRNNLESKKTAENEKVQNWNSTQDLEDLQNNSSHLEINSKTQTLAKLDENLSLDLSLETHLQILEIDDKINQVLADFQIPNKRTDELSGGQKRKLAIAQSLFLEPQILILDEPTNHLDIESVELVENILKNFAKSGKTVILVSHDRYFLDKLTTQFWEIFGGKIFEHNGKWQNYLQNKQIRLQIAGQTEDRKQAFLKREIEWVRAGVKARSTKDKGRLDRFYDLEGEKKFENEKLASFMTAPILPLGNKVLEFENLDLCIKLTEDLVNLEEENSQNLRPELEENSLRNSTQDLEEDLRQNLTQNEVENSVKKQNGKQSGKEFDQKLEQKTGKELTENSLKMQSESGEFLEEVLENELGKLKTKLEEKLEEKLEIGGETLDKNYQENYQTKSKITLQKKEETEIKTEIENNKKTEKIQNSLESLPQNSLGNSLKNPEKETENLGKAGENDYKNSWQNKEKSELENIDEIQSKSEQNEKNSSQIQAKSNNLKIRIESKIVDKNQEIESQKFEVNPKKLGQNDEENLSKINRIEQNNLEIGNKENQNEKCGENQDKIIQKTQKILKNLNFTFHPKTVLGIIGQNGCGKTSLIRAILGQIPFTGKITIGQNTVFNYQDQNKLELNEENSIFEELCESLESTKFGTNLVSSRKYLKNLLFENEQILSKIKNLSGGQKARIMLAKILKNEGNCLILDEPTNDLDLQTIELLEKSVQNFEGICVIISHDRYFLNQVCTDILAILGDGRFVLSTGNYDEYLAKTGQNSQNQFPQINQKLGQNSSNSYSKNNIEEKANEKAIKTDKNSWQQQKTWQKDLQKTEKMIEKLETEIKSLEIEFENVDLYAQNPDKYNQKTKKLENLKSELDEKILDWENLSENLSL